MLIPVSTHVPWFSPICPRLNFPFLSFETFLTIRQNSLYVTVCMIARTSYQGYFIHSLSTLYYYNAPSLATRLTGDYRDRTCTGKCGPASLDTRYRKVLLPALAMGTNPSVHHGGFVFFMPQYAKWLPVAGILYAECGMLPKRFYSREAMSQVAVFARIFGECREGQIPRSSAALQWHQPVQ